MVEEDAHDADPRAIWFLDVDGVLNALSLAPGEHYREAHLNGFPIKWNPAIVEHINEIHSSGRVNIVWLTTWGKDANTFISPALGLPEFEVAADPDDEAVETFGRDWWKFKTVQEWHADNLHKRFVWTDDDLAIEREATQWARMRNFYIAHPNPYKGLLTNEIDHIRSFINGPSQG